MNYKIRNLKEKQKNLNLEGMIVSNPVNIKYLTNIESEGTLLITRKENIFLTYTMYIEDVNRTLTIDDEIIVADMRDISVEEAENFFVFCENIGFEENYVTYEQYKRQLLAKYSYGNINDITDNKASFTIEGLVDGIAPRVKFIEKTKKIFQPMSLRFILSGVNVNKFSDSLTFTANKDCYLIGCLSRGSSDSSFTISIDNEVVCGTTPASSTTFINLKIANGQSVTLSGGNVAQRTGLNIYQAL